MKTTGYFVIYLKKDGSVVAGELCSTPECAVGSIHPDEKAETFGPYPVTIDTEADKFKREDKINLNDGGVIARNLFLRYHPVVEN